ncbi:MAG: hypothetical protein KAJ19_26995 [Gammaproteobacteria bacterium]|nr:hypothetical protein [Gammaproteobacteria bacterium]
MKNVNYFERNATKAELAQSAAAQLTYILSALGLADDAGAAEAIQRALESKGSLRDAAVVTAHTLAQIKRAVRALVERPLPCAPGCRVCPDTDKARDHHTPDPLQNTAHGRFRKLDDKGGFAFDPV